MNFKTILSGALFCALGSYIQAQDTPSNKVTIKSNGNKVKITSTINISDDENIASFIDSIVGITDLSIQKLQNEFQHLNVQNIQLDSLDKVLRQLTIRLGDSTGLTYPSGDKILLGIVIDDYSNTQDLKYVHPIVSNVIPNSPAAEAGLLKNDIIFKVDQEEVNLISDVTKIITEKNEGDSLALEIIRNTDTLRTTAILRLVPRNENWLSLLKNRLAPIDSITSKLPFCEKIIIQKSGPRLGVSVIDLNEEARKSLKAKKGGALVTKVIENTTAQTMKLQVNDVIISFNGHEIQNITELKNLVDALSVPNSVQIKYIRYGKKKSAKGVISEFRKAWDDNNTNMNVIDMSQYFKD